MVYLHFIITSTVQSVLFYGVNFSYDEGNYISEM